MAEQAQAQAQVKKQGRPRIHESVTTISISLDSTLVERLPKKQRSTFIREAIMEKLSREAEGSADRWV